jgi:hypothetical protein
MPFIPVPNTIEYTVTVVTAGDKYQNVFHSRPNFGESTDLPIQDRIASVRAAWGNRIMPRLANSCALTIVTGRDLSTIESPSAELGGAQINGALAGEISPAQVTALIQKRTTLSGRARRGRLYLSGLRDIDVEGGAGVLVPAYHTTLQTAFDQFLSDIQAIGGLNAEQMVVVSRYLGVDASGKPIPRVQGLATPIVKLLVTASIATQRDRNRR